MQKKYILFLLLLFSAFGTVIAETSDPSTISTPPEQKSEIEDNTNIKNLPFFNTVTLSSIGTLHIIQSSEPRLTIEADKKILPLITAYVKEKTLYIDMKNSDLHTQAKINYVLAVKDLNSIILSSSANVEMHDFQTNELNLSIGSFGEANIQIFVQRFNARIEGGGKINARGSAQQQSIEIHGAGEFNGKKFSGNAANVTINGSGMVGVAVTDLLTVNISNEGRVEYCKEPKIIKDIKKDGKVTPASDC